MAAIVLIKRNFSAEDMLKLGEENIETKLNFIGKDVYFEYNYISFNIRPFYEGKTVFEFVDVNHMVHDCEDDIDLFIWGCQNPIDFYNWQYEERGYKEQKKRKEALKNDKFKKMNDDIIKKREEKRKEQLKNFDIKNAIF